MQSFKHKDANVKFKKKRVVLEDEASDWLQISIVASSLDVKGKNAIKIICFSR